MEFGHPAIHNDDMKARGTGGLLPCTATGTFSWKSCVYFWSTTGFGHATFFGHKIWLTLVPIQPFQKHPSIDFFCHFQLLSQLHIWHSQRPLAPTPLLWQMLTQISEVVEFSRIFEHLRLARRPWAFWPPNAKEAIVFSAPPSYSSWDVHSFFFNRLRSLPQKPEVSSNELWKRRLPDDLVKFGRMIYRLDRLNSHPFQSPRTDPTSSSKSTGRASVFDNLSCETKNLPCPSAGKVSPQRPTHQMQLKTKQPRNVSYLEDHPS